ncbi:13798_t:CDS:2, partial [Cetraspora pellucida]
IVISEETSKLKVQKTIEYCELPKNFQRIKLIELQDVIGYASVTTSLCKNYESIHNISEILYKLDGCRTCQASKEQLTNNNLDLAQLLRYCYITKEQLNEVLSVSTAREHEIIMT